MTASSHEIRLHTRRLLLRPTEPPDAERAFEILSDWLVTRMLRMATFPPDIDELRSWFTSHVVEWRDERAYRFAIEEVGRVIGIVDLTKGPDGEFELGYWLEQSSWGRGLASEAAEAIVTFGLDAVGLATIRSGHAIDNPASGRILKNLGFRHIDNIVVHSRSRGTDIMQSRYVLNISPRRTV